MEDGGEDYGGLQAIHSNLLTKLTEVREEGTLGAFERETFNRLEQHEAKAIRKRVSKLQEEVRQQEERESRLQKTYKVRFFTLTQNLDVQALKDVERRIQDETLRRNATVSGEAVNY